MVTLQLKHGRTQIGRLEPRSYLRYDIGFHNSSSNGNKKLIRDLGT